MKEGEEGRNKGRRREDRDKVEVHLREEKKIKGRVREGAWEGRQRSF